MLKILRLHTKTIVWFVVVSFVIWGGYSMTTLRKEGRYAGEAFGKPVTFQEYNKFYRATELFMPEKNRSELEDPEVVRTFTWQNIVYSREAQRLGIAVTDSEVRDQIATILTQQGLSNPTREQYHIWLTRNLRVTPREFEEGLREIMRIQKFLKTKFEEFTPKASGEKPADPKKAEEELAQKKQASFILWTNDLNQRAKLRDYLAVSTGEKPAPEAAVLPDGAGETAQASPASVPAK
ncbi:MAG TPA: SurA N-terminal domain-containing protein [Candidatus Omnitrophota bacterium]|jgi:hypothetical protein|nr:MAG: hypothetical protein BWY49_00603 [Candidatus Omnitrophica bacterium ADurb.Bin314]HOE68425.1 SurA N-terminal domain-containing protein [Candidatus Omnitrophota bacterium]HPW65058.1 SurA N-terminal domain-containing protein [Candidatus Omnitrophota bacterium]HQB94853.1 SurA N-terminal domain-containing protein [Candidatus Omnitrophota bacterium]